MLSKYRDKQAEEGFTLIELLVVIIIIGILAAIAIPTFLGQRERARRSAAQSDLRNLAVAQETYFTDESKYTTNLGDLEFNMSDEVTTVIIASADPTREWCAFAVVPGLPTDDGDGWYFDSDGDPQLRPQTDGGC